MCFYVLSDFYGSWYYRTPRGKIKHKFKISYQSVIKFLKHYSECLSYSYQAAVAVKRSYHSLHMNNCCCSLHSAVATLDCCRQPARKWEIKFTLEFLQTEIMCCVCINIHGTRRSSKRAKTTSALHDTLDRLINPEFQKLWASLFHIHLKAKMAVCTPFPCPALSVANRLYQWKQHQFVQDDTFSE